MNRADKEHFNMLLVYTCVTLIAWMLMGGLYQYLTQ